MTGTRKVISAVGAAATMAAMTAVGAIGPAGASTAPGYEPVPGSAVPFTAHTRAAGSVAGSTPLTIQVWLRPHLAAAERFASAVSTPGSPRFGQYLSPDGYTARFGATGRQAGRVEAWLRTAGFTGIHTDSQRTYVRATAAASKIEAAFGVRLKLYRASATANAGPYPLRANDRPISLPASLADSVLGVTGLDNAAPLLPLGRTGIKPANRPVGPAAPCSHYYGQHKATGLPEHFGTATFPTEVCGYSADQLRAAYGARPQNTGKGQAIALVELGLTRDMFRTLQDYAAASHTPAPSARRYAELSLGRGSACGDPFNIEEQLDVEAAYDMAPGAAQLVVGGDSCNTGDFGLQGLLDADIAILGGTGHHPLASVASNSWESVSTSQPPFLTGIEHAYLMRAAAEGVGMYFSSGDRSGVYSPSSDPFAVSVGGTTLGIGKTNNRLFETGWSTGVSFLIHGAWVFAGEQGAAGGGPSSLWNEPAYQHRVVPPALTKPPGHHGGPVRSVPDVSADADPTTGMAVGMLTFHHLKPPTFHESDVAGTSLAAPLVAGMATAAQQGQSRPFGFIDPAIYKLARTNAVHDALPLTPQTPVLYRGTTCIKTRCGAVGFRQGLTTFDDQSPGMPGYSGQVTLNGYDNMTGIGTPDGPHFIRALRNLEK